MEDPTTEHPQRRSHPLPIFSDNSNSSSSATPISELLRAAHFMSEDSDRRVFQRFDELRVSVLLRLQHRLVAMGAEIDRLRRLLDKRNREGRGGGDDDADDERVLDELVEEAGKVLREYDDAFLAQARFEGLRSPSADFMSKFIKHNGVKFPQLPHDLGATGLRAFRADALASTAVTEKSAFHRLIDRHEFLHRFFAVKSERNNQASAVFIYSELAISRVERMFVHISFCILLLCPIIALSVIQSVVGKLATVIGFLLLGAFLTSGVLTGANNNGLAVLAGYGAILIFFLGVRVDFTPN